MIFYPPWASQRPAGHCCWLGFRLGCHCSSAVVEPCCKSTKSSSRFGFGSFFLSLRQQFPDFGSGKNFRSNRRLFSIRKFTLLGLADERERRWSHTVFFFFPSFTRQSGFFVSSSKVDNKSETQQKRTRNVAQCWRMLKKKNKIKTRGLLKVVMWSWSLLLTNQSPDKFLSPYFFQCSQTHEADSFYCSAITATKLLDLRLYSEENPETVPAFIAWPWRHTALGFSSRLAWHLAVNWIWH